MRLTPAGTDRHAETDLATPPLGTQPERAYDTEEYVHEQEGHHGEFLAVLVLGKPELVITLVGKEGDTVDEGVIYRHPIRCFLQESVHLILGHRAFRTYR